MSDEDAVALVRAPDLLGLSATDVRRWGREDGWEFVPTDDGPGARKGDLRRSLLKRGLPIPRALEHWPSVLIADDDADVLQVIQWLVQQVYPEAEVRTARDGEQALRLLAESAPHLLVTDLKMPLRDGLALCRAIETDRRLAGVKILAISGQSSSREAFFERGALEFAQKPFDPRSVRRSIARLLGPED